MLLDSLGSSNLQNRSIFNITTLRGQSWRRFSLSFQSAAQHNRSLQCLALAMDAKILRLNISGQPIEWLSWKEAVCLHARGVVVWTLGGIVKKVMGGRSRFTGQRSTLDLPAIIACDGTKIARVRTNPLLTNAALFYRDNCQCMYCGNYFAITELSRDHVVPSSRGGRDKWENVVAACRRCNQHKGNYLLSEINMDLIALPYRPNPYEYMALINSRRIRMDQMEYLRPQFSKYSGFNI